MAHKSGRSVTVVGESSDLGLNDPVTVIELSDFAGWEFVAATSKDGQMTGLTVQPAGTWWHQTDPTGHDKPASAAGGVTARLLRSVPIGEIRATAERSVRRRAVDALYQARVLGLGSPAQRFPGAIESIRGWNDALTERPGRRGRPDEEYLAVAAEYARCIEDGDATPVATIAARHNYAASTVRNWIHEARRRELLTKVGPGRAGGALTEKAIEMIQRSEDADGQR